MTKNIIYTISALMFFVTSFSQESDKKLIKGDKFYDKLSYIKSIEVYEKVANKGYKSVELFEKLGDSYFFNSQYTEANKWYTELFALNETVEPIYYYRYSQTLKSVGDSKKADQYLQEFSKLNIADDRAIQYKENKNYLSDIENNSNRYTVENAGINSAFSDYGSSIYNDTTLVFTSSRLPEKGSSKKDSWTSDYYSAIYSASLSKEGKLNNVKFFPKEIQTQYHESNPVFSKDGKTMYFTRNNSLKSKKSGSDKVLMLKIYKATFVNGKWGNVTELPFNSNVYSCAHPALSSDEKTLYFVSNMPGGFGDSDIYKVAIADENIYGNPMNLGKNINTHGKETFPFVNDKSELFFASDGHLGLGGLDVFVTNIKDDSYSNKINNVGKPINSAFDDFCFTQLNNSKLGFFTSNREGGQGKDDIYCFNELKGLEQNSIEGVIVDKETNEPIPNAIVAIYDYNHNIVATTKADQNGKFKTSIENTKGTTHYIKAESPEYETQEITVNDDKVNLKKVVVGLAKVKDSIAEGKNIAKTLNIKNIFFDLDKSIIRHDAEVELQKVVQVMKDYPNLKIDIRSHTDSRQSNNYNLKLSERRAKSTRDYLIANGIANNRLTGKGYGETKLLNKCADGITCSEDEHQANRRSEFIIIGL